MLVVVFWKVYIVNNTVHIRRSLLEPVDDEFFFAGPPIDVFIFEEHHEGKSLSLSLSHTQTHNEAAHVHVPHLTPTPIFGHANNIFFLV